MTEIAERAVSLEALVPDQRAITYPGQDAWMEVQQAVTAPGANRLPNFGFEDASGGTPGWGPTWAGVTLTRTTAEQHSGAASCQVVVADFTGNPSKGMYSGPLSMPAGRLRAVAWVKGAAGAAFVLAISDGSFGPEASVPFTGTGAWQRVTVDFVAPAASTHMWWIPTTTLGTFYVDDCEFFPVVAAPTEDIPWLHVEDAAGVPAIPGKPLATTVNPTQIKTTTAKFGGSSLYTPGIGYALTTPDSEDWNLGSGDFTIEGFYYVLVVRKAIFAQIATNGADNAWEVTMDTGSAGAQVLSFLYATGAGAAMDVQVDRPFFASLNQWYHIAIVRSGSVLKHFVDGAQLGADYNIGAAVIRNSAAPLRIGGDARTTGNDFNGYQDELRISKGIARYTSNFTVPTAPFVPDSYTKLLCHFDAADGTTPTVDDTGVPGIPFNPGADPAWMQVEH